MADANHALDAASAQDNAVSGNHSKTAGRPFERGTDPRRNLRGRPPAGEAYADYIRAYLDMPFEDLLAELRNAGKLPAKKLMALRQVLDGVADGDAAMLGVAARVRAYTYNRLDGMPTQQVETSSAADDALAAQLDALGDALREASEKEEAS